MLVALLLPVDLSRKFLLAIHEDVEFSRSDSAAVNAGDFQACADVEGSDRILKKASGHTGVEQRAEEHIAADTGKTIEVGDPHVVVGL
jgi:hypothetical protein